MSSSLPVTSQKANLLGGVQLIAPASNFATVSLTSTTAILSNRLSPLDQEERLTYSARELKSVDTRLQIRNPAPVRSGVSYSITLEETLRTVVDDKVVDEPIVAYLSVRHPRSANVTVDVLQQVLQRLLGAVIIPAHSVSDTAVRIDSTGVSRTRFPDLARLAELPVIDNLGAAQQDS